ncbi:HNH endonuclease [Pseudoalteromonas ostreae]|uniref:HNH endonuclease n=1 Tax=Pseudoalteromonas ostreae TaxID=2774154 RepID=UPI001B364B00|nr:HNH endonuclease signature motif containing protein [Pseudoalteromonas ostreae]
MVLLSRNPRGWAFVNHKDKVVIFGAWDVNTESNRALILSTEWEFNEGDRRQNAYGEATEYIKLVESQGYSLKTFPMILGEDTSTGGDKIKAYVEVLSDMSLEIISGEYYAVGKHDRKYSNKSIPNIAQDVSDIFDSIVENTERESLILARIGQGEFRQNVIKAWGNGEYCALTLTNVREILIASHIVPWSKCSSNEQRLDGANGILLCAHIDKLFDAHLLTFIKRGPKFVSKLSSKIDASRLKTLGIEAGYELCTEQLGSMHFEQFEKYLAENNKIFEWKYSE